MHNSISSAGTLVISFIGLQTQEVDIQPVMKVVMQSDDKVLDEVVVTGYGVQRKASFTGAATIVGEDVIAKKSDANFVKALEGAVPGVQMNNSTSMPGIWGSIYVRGRGSLNSGTQPLYVIDGMPVDSDTDEGSLTATSNNSVDPMSMLNPADIESITVLKDAAATAIYGSRAANGVIVITTKKGKEGKFNINLDVKQGFVSMANNNMDFANAEQTMNLFADTSYSYSTQNGFSLSTSGSMSSPVVAAISSMTPMYPVYDSEGNYANIGNYNPMALMDETAGELNENKMQTINLNPYFQIDFGKGIYAKTTLGVNINELNQYQYWSAQYNPQGMDYNGLGQLYNSKSTVITWNNIIGRRATTTNISRSQTSRSLPTVCVT